MYPKLGRLFSRLFLIPLGWIGISISSAGAAPEEISVQGKAPRTAVVVEQQAMLRSLLGGDLVPSQKCENDFTLSRSSPQPANVADEQGSPPPPSYGSPPPPPPPP
jgi:hypothetical protein